MESFLVFIFSLGEMLISWPACMILIKYLFKCSIQCYSIGNFFHSFLIHGVDPKEKKKKNFQIEKYVLIRYIWLQTR